MKTLQYEGIPIDITNIFAQVDPVIKDPDHPGPSYLMLIAHYDSRYPQKVLDKTVLSYGAADDGYGCGVALECLRQALRYRGEWRQGIKILLTEFEEWKLAGINSALEHNPEILIMWTYNQSRKPWQQRSRLLFETVRTTPRCLLIKAKAHIPTPYDGSL